MSGEPLYRQKFKEGLASLPWNLFLTCMVAGGIFLLSGNYAGNAIRCAVFDSSGCLPRLDARVEASRVPPDQIQLLIGEKNLTPLEPKVKNTLSEYTLYRFDIFLTNLGVSSVQNIDLFVAIYPHDRLRGSVISRTSKLDKTNIMLKEHSFATTKYSVIPGDFQDEDSVWRNEKFNFTLIARLADGLSIDQNTIIFVLYMKCDGCQANFTRLDILNGDIS